MVLFLRQRFSCTFFWIPQGSAEQRLTGLSEHDGGGEGAPHHQTPRIRPGDARAEEGGGGSEGDKTKGCRCGQGRKGSHEESEGGSGEETEGEGKTEEVKGEGKT